MKIQDLLESSLSRLHSKIGNHSSGAISGFRGNNTNAQNKQNNREIVIYLKQRGYSVTKTKGSYIENFETDNAREVSEPSFFVVNDRIEGNDGGMLKDDLVRLGRRFDQDSVLIVPVGGVNAYLLGTSERDDSFPPLGRIEIVGSGRYGRAAGEFLSRVNNREFAFERVEFPDTINGKRGWSILFERMKEEMDVVL